jgi:hypothetical protein
LAPVSPAEIIRSIAAYDMGFYLLEPSSFNNAMALPNKIFDFIAAGLAVCVGPSPEMASLVNEYRIGCVTPTFKPADVAAVLNRITFEDLDRMKASSQKAARLFNADIEMQKLLRLYRDVLENREN